MNSNAAFIGPTVWELEGPIPILKMSNTLMVMSEPLLALYDTCGGVARLICRGGEALQRPSRFATLGGPSRPHFSELHRNRQDRLPVAPEPSPPRPSCSGRCRSCTKRGGGTATGASLNMTLNATPMSELSSPTSSLPRNGEMRLRM